MPGKTVGDILDEILTQPKKWLSLLGFLVVLCLLIVGVMIAFTYLFGVETREVELGKDSHIIFEATDRGRGTAEYIVLVNPQGWQPSGIAVHPGDRLTFSAGGKICIDLQEIVDKVSLRKAYEEKYTKLNNIKTDDAQEKRVPEDFFTDDERESLIPKRPWVGPEGYSLATYQPSYRSRRNRYLLPGENAAGLVAAIKSGSEQEAEPTGADAFFVGNGKSRDDFEVTREGWLWFTVNDVQFSDDKHPENSRLFYNDNVGAFWVRVVQKRNSWTIGSGGSR
jgi:hypothetical protein